MRLLTAPNQIVPDVTLSCQSHVPEADRIKWQAKILTTAQRVTYREALDAAYQMKDGPDRDAAMNAVIKRCATDWSNVLDEKDQPLPFGDESLNLLTPEFRLMAANELPEAAGWGDALQKKGSASR